jgi:hypothetical protein
MKYTAVATVVGCVGSWERTKGKQCAYYPLLEACFKEVWGEKKNKKKVKRKKHFKKQNLLNSFFFFFPF